MNLIINNMGKITRPLRLIYGMPAILLMLGGCTGESAGDTSNTGSGGPAYAFQTRVISPDLSMITDYIKFTDSLGSEAKIDESKTIEVMSTGSIAYDSSAPGEFFLEENGSGQVVKYTFGPDGRAVEAGRISFAGYGVTTLESSAFFAVSSTKAYLFDGTTFQFFAWDPSTMTILSNADVSKLFNNMENGKSYFINRERHLKWMGKKLVSTYWYRDPSLATSVSRSGVLVIDTETDTLTVVEHPTCGGFWNSMIGPDGYLYVASSNLQAAFYFTGVGTASCFVRFDPVMGAFDTTYNVDISTLVGKPAGAIVASTGKSAYVWGLNEALIPDGASKDVPAQVIASQAFEAYRIDDVTNPTTATLVDMLPTSYPIFVSSLDERVYFSNAEVKGSGHQTTLMDATTDPPTAGLVTEGIIFAVIHVQ
jgi:hypothetical protein